ncbi:MAG TPA: flagellar biosynthesis protein FlhB [Bacteroidota bacterium]|nr:flagellar biosynthesis protein FlhB [Bacteroidota bacterium]
MPESFQEKTEQATPKKKEDTRKRGKVARSAELNSAVILMVGLFILSFSGPMVIGHLTDVFRSSLGSAGVTQVNVENLREIALQQVGGMTLALLPVFAGLLLIGIGISVAQVGFMISAEALTPRFENINPLSGLRKMFFSQRTIVEVLKNLLKVVIIAAIAYYAVRNLVNGAFELMNGDVPSIADAIVSGSLGIGLKIGLAFLGLAALDYFYQRYQYEQDLRMTKQELKEESKQTDGDPIVKSRIRLLQRRIAYRRMMHDVPKADVVVTNPTHYAVALKYDAEKMSAPKVVAKGADHMAQRIREIAAEHHVPIVEDRMLARTLYQTIDIGEEIPEKLFQAVAQVLAYIYRLKHAKPGKRRI